MHSHLAQPRDTESAAPQVSEFAASPEPLRRRPRAADPLGGTAVDPAIAQRLAKPTAGRALNPEVRGPLESAFGADFSGVNVHTDGNAAQLARDVQATAFTHGNNIFFSEGSYDTGTTKGQHLLAHELTHVVQQQRGNGGAAASPAAGPVIGRADDPAEAEADRAAHDVVGSLQRQAAACGNAGHSDPDHR